MRETEIIRVFSHLLSLSPENEVVEFKEAKNDFDFNKLGRYFSAISNEANLKEKDFGWLVFGIRDHDRSVVGSKYRASSRSHLESLKSDVANKTTNRITFIEIFELALPEGRVIMFQIPAAPKGIPIAWDGHYYGRDDEELGPLNLEEIERIRKQVAFTDWSAGIVQEANISDLDPEEIISARKNFEVKNPRLSADVQTWTDEIFLKKAKLTIGNKITRTAILLLGLPESEHFLYPGLARVTWELRDANNSSKDYEHFSCPFILANDQVFAKIRNLKYRYLKNDTLFPDEVNQYDTFSIREALNNCIAHQDYNLAGRINVIEHEDGKLIFSNEGDFLPGSVESVIESDEPPRFYRNAFLAHAMVNLNMIDTVGSGIKRMFQKQRERFFPMPDYDFTDKRVKATLFGKILDEEYVKVLARNPQLTLEEIILLDKVQKKKVLDDADANLLRGKGLIEGKKPNLFISEKLAVSTKQVAKYIKLRGEDNEYYRKIVYELISKNQIGTDKREIRGLLSNKLPEIFDESQKENRISYILKKLKEEGKIQNLGTDAKPKWVPLNM